MRGLGLSAADLVLAAGALLLGCPGTGGVAAPPGSTVLTEGRGVSSLAADGSDVYSSTGGRIFRASK